MTTQQRGRRKARVGVVVSDKMDKTRVVAVRWSMEHPLYKRPVRKVTRFKAHDGDNATRTGDTVRIVETRPLSKDKRWRITDILVKGEAVEIAPAEVGASIEEEFGQRPAAEEAPAPETATEEESK
jgi:small subunit ribosomal protein S17